MRFSVFRQDETSHRKRHSPPSSLRTRMLVQKDSSYLPLIHWEMFIQQDFRMQFEIVVTFVKRRLEQSGVSNRI